MKVASEYLYHYTNTAGLYGILENKCIWASHYKSLNDYAEIDIFKEKLIDILLPKIGDKLENGRHKNINITPEKISYTTRLCVEKIYESAKEVVNNEIYIASFCRDSIEDGLLSQWRGYGSDGGYAIVFPRDRLEKLLNTEKQLYRYDFCFAENVIYSNNREGDDKLASRADHIARHIVYMIEHQKPPPHDIAEKSYAAFISSACTYKHYGFREEQEYRIVAIPLASGISESKEQASSVLDKKRNFRPGYGGKVPYIELFGEDQTSNAESYTISAPDFLLSIKEIVVGPHKEKEIRTSALHTWLKNADCVKGNNINVRVSGIPYMDSKSF
ncbi:hypothetical protein MTYM_02090 [Methylococcales bacterium]|nr:hypothetical protein MTYM_02090 [Methylococcales bacterium]